MEEKAVEAAASVCNGIWCWWTTAAEFDQRSLVVSTVGGCLSALGAVLSWKAFRNADSARVAAENVINIVKRRQGEQEYLTSYSDLLSEIRRAKEVARSRRLQAPQYLHSGKRKENDVSKIMDAIDKIEFNCVKIDDNEIKDKLMATAESLKADLRSIKMIPPDEGGWERMHSKINTLEPVIEKAISKIKFDQMS